MIELPLEEIRTSDTCKAIEVQLSGSWYRAYAGRRGTAINIEGNPFYGAGASEDGLSVLSIGEIVQDDSRTATTVPVSLNGLSTTFLSTIRESDLKGCPVRMFVVWVSKTTPRNIVHIQCVFQGYIDTANFAFSAQAGVIQCTVADWWAKARKAKIKRYSDAQQQADHSGDTIFSHYNTANAEIYWNGSRQNPTTSPTTNMYKA